MGATKPSLLIVAYLTIAVTACSEVQDDRSQVPMQTAPSAGAVADTGRGTTEAATLTAIQAYFDGLNRKDISAVPFAPDAVFSTPMIPEPIRGEAAVRRFVESTLPGFTGTQVERHIVDGEHAFTLFRINWPQRGGSIPSSDYFYVVDGRIKEIRVYFDPRPLVGDGEYDGVRATEAR